MTYSTSVAMTATTERQLLDLVVRDDGQEDLCLATYRPSTGATRSSALIVSVIPPDVGDRFVHGNATVTGRYVLRGAQIARNDGCGLVLLHSHPGASGWQAMSPADRDAEVSYANLAREFTELPLVGMTVATDDVTWSARHWNIGAGKRVDCTHSTNVRVVGGRLAVSWNDALAPPPSATGRQVRTVSAWGESCQADLARRRVLVVGAGSVGLDIIVRLAASGVQVNVMDFDIVETHNLDRLIGATRRDVRLRRPKIHIAHREATRAATAEAPAIEVFGHSICELEGLRVALDHDLIFACVDRPWPRAVLNAMAYSDLIPVIDGGIAIDTFADGSMKNATWRSHVIRPQRPCMSCNRQLCLGQVNAERQGVLDDPTYIVQASGPEYPQGQNVAPLSISASAAMLAQYVSFSVAPCGLGDPGPLQYALNHHNLYRPRNTQRSHCPIEAEEGLGDQRTSLTSRHERAERTRELAGSLEGGVPLVRCVDNLLERVAKWLDRR